MRLSLILFWLAATNLARAECDFNSENQLFMRKFDERLTKTRLRVESNGVVYCFRHEGTLYSIKVIDFMLSQEGIEAKLIKFTKQWNASVEEDKRIDLEFSIQTIIEIGKMIRCLEFSTDLENITRLEHLNCNLQISSEPRIVRLFNGFLFSLINEIKSAHDELALHRFLSDRTTLSENDFARENTSIHQKSKAETLRREKSMLSYKMHFCAKQTPLRYLLVTEGCGELINSGSLFDAFSNLRLNGRVLLYLEMARAIYYFHRYKIAHCNINPYAFIIRFTKQSYVTLGDLSFASSSHACTESNVQYMAPEIAKMKGSTSKINDQYLKSDIYSFGLVIADIENEVKRCEEIKPSAINNVMSLTNNFHDKYSSMMRAVYSCLEKSWDLKLTPNKGQIKGDIYKGSLMKRFKAIVAHMLAIDPAKRPSIDIVVSKLLAIHMHFNQEKFNAKKFQQMSDDIRNLIEEKGLDRFLLVPFSELMDFNLDKYKMEL